MLFQTLLVTHIGLYLLNSFNKIEGLNWTLMICSSQTNIVISFHVYFCASDFLHTYSPVCAGANGNHWDETLCMTFQCTALLRRRCVWGSHIFNSNASLGTLPDPRLRCTPIKYLITLNIDDNAPASSRLRAVYSWGSNRGHREKIATSI